jgi:hypothetical protein
VQYWPSRIFVFCGRYTKREIATCRGISEVVLERGYAMVFFVRKSRGCWESVLRFWFTSEVEEMKNSGLEEAVMKWVMHWKKRVGVFSLKFACRAAKSARITWDIDSLCFLDGSPYLSTSWTWLCIVSARLVCSSFQFPGPAWAVEDALVMLASRLCSETPDLWYVRLPTAMPSAEL